MTRRPEHSFEHIVTVCATKNNVRSSCRGDESIGLLFIDTTRETHDDIEELSWLMRHPDVEKFFGRAVMGLRVLRGYKDARHSYWRNQERKPEGDAWLITPDVTACFLAEPDPPRPVYLRVGDMIVKVETTMRTWDSDACWMLTKTFGCDKCPMNGADCFWANLDRELKIATSAPADPRQLELFCQPPPFIAVAAVQHKAYQEENNSHLLDWQTWRDEKQDNLITIAGYAYIKPLLTAEQAPAPDTQGCRPPAEHFVSEIERVREALSERTAKRNRTYGTIRRECKVCLFGHYNERRNEATPCQRWSPQRCEHGAWKSEERIVDYTLEILANSLEGCDYTLDDMWRLANVCGQPFQRKMKGRVGGQQEWALCRLTSRYRYGDPPQQPRIQVLARPTGTYARRNNSELLMTKADVYAFLPDNLKAIWDAPPPLDRKALALWLHVAITSNGAGRRCGWGSYHPEHGRCGLRINYPGYPPRIFTELWESRCTGEHEFRDFQGIYSYYDRLPWLDVLEKEDSEKNKHAWGY